MRLLTFVDGSIVLAGPFSSDEIPTYAILSHTWGDDRDEVTFDDLLTSQGKSKAGYRKIEFCGTQAEKDGIEFFWVDTCCIKKADSSELSEAITSMYRWYAEAAKCYVYLPDVDSDGTESDWAPSFLKSRWFTRGWTLQELVAPKEVLFYSQQGNLLGSKQTLAEYIHKTTTIPLAVLHGASVTQYSVAERLRWAEPRNTSKKEDKAYCLLGLLNIYMPLIYGEGENAFCRLERELEVCHAPPKSQRMNSFKGMYSYNGVYPVNSYVARPELERHVADQLDHGRIKHMRTVVVWGLGGSGKSQLIRNFVREYGQNYQAVLWIDASSKVTIERDFTRINKQICENSNITESSVEDSVFLVKYWLSQQTDRCLCIFDGADNVDDATDKEYIDLSYYSPEASQLDRIITTRSSRLCTISSQKAIEVHQMRDAEAVKLLKRSSGLDIAEGCMLEIVKELGCLALAVTLAGSYISEDPELLLNPSLYLIQLREQRFQLLQQKPHRVVHQYGENMLSTWEISYHRIYQQSPLAAQMLALLGFLNPEDIFLDLFLVEPHSQSIKKNLDVTSLPDIYDWTGEYIEKRQKLSQPIEKLQWIELAAAAKTPIDANSIRAALKMLRGFSFLSWRMTQRSYGMHQLVNAWCKARLELASQEQWRRAALELIAQAASKYTEDLTLGVRLVPHIITIISPLLDNKQSAQTDRRDRQSLQIIAELVSRLGLWNFEQHIRMFLRQETEVVLGLDHPDSMDSIHDLARVLSRRKKYAEAEQVCHLELGLRTKHIENAHTCPDISWPYLLAAVDCFAGTLHGQGKFNQAESLYAIVTNFKMRIWGIEDIRTLASTSNLARIYQSRGQIYAAEECCRKALTLRMTVLGEHHPDTLASMNDLATLLCNGGKQLQARRLCRQVLAIRVRVLGPRHPDTLMSIQTLAEMLRGHADGEALGLFRKAFELRKQVLGDEHPDTLTSMFCLGTILYDVDWNNPSISRIEGKDLLLKALEKRIMVIGEEHPETLTSMHGLAQALPPGDAMKLLLKTLKSRQRVLGDDHPDTLTTMFEIARLHEKRSEYSAAERLYRVVHEARVRILGEHHDDTERSERFIGGIELMKELKTIDSDTDSEKGVVI